MKHTVLKNSYKANGSSYRGELDVSYERLVEVFGEPEEGDGYKVQKEWTIEFEDGEVATIYDWKWGYEYNGKDGTHYTEVPTWNIGGHSIVVVDRIKELVK